MPKWLHLRIAVLRGLYLAVGALASTLTVTTLAGAQRPAVPAPPATVAGTVIDSDGDAIESAQVALTLSSDATGRKTLTDSDGGFTFSNLPPGSFTLTLTADGFASATRSGTLHAGEQYVIQPLTLPVAASMDVQVVVSPHDQAEAEVKAEEKQRLAGFLPNYFVTYNWHAAPLNSRQKYELAWKTTIDPATFLVTGAIAGVQQAQNDFSGYGQGAQGYGKRYAAVFAGNVSGNFIAGAILPSLLHQDPRYFYKGTGSIRSRTLYALAASVVCRGDNGHWQPNYSSVLGGLAAGGISNLYYPAGNRNGIGLTLENGLLGVIGDAVGNVVQEFVFRHITPHLAQNSSAKAITPP